MVLWNKPLRPRGVGLYSGPRWGRWWGSNLARRAIDLSADNIRNSEPNCPVAVACREAPVVSVERDQPCSAVRVSLLPGGPYFIRVTQFYADRRSSGASTVFGYLEVRTAIPHRSCPRCGCSRSQPRQPEIRERGRCGLCTRVKASGWVSVSGPRSHFSPLETVLRSVAHYVDDRQYCCAQDASSDGMAQFLGFESQIRICCDRGKQHRPDKPPS
jgi:hypothetical protein